MQQFDPPSPPQLLVPGCWNLLDDTASQSLRGLATPGRKEPEAAYRQRFANAQPSGCFSDALRTYAWMLASVQCRKLLRRLGS